MSIRLSAGAAALALAAVLMLDGGPALADERVCRSTLGAITVDDVRVPQNATCRMTGTRVKGNIKIYRGATLDASRVVVIGNVQGEGARSVTVRNSSRIGGDVQVKQGRAATVSSSTVDGNVQLESNSGLPQVISSVVDGDVQAFQNRGGVTIRNNPIDGNLQCKSNNPAPTGGSNIVQGNKEDQCRRL